MKNFLASLALVATIIGQAAHANVMMLVRSAPITKIQLDPNSPNRLNAPSGKVTINDTMQTVSLTFSDNRYFMAKIVSVNEDLCGTVTTVARDDKRMVDGGLTEIVVQDHTNLRCRIYVPAQTQISVTTKSSMYNATHTSIERNHYFEAEQLQAGHEVTGFAY